MKRSWKTSLGGVLAALGTALAGALEQPWREVAAAVAALGVALVGLTARDDNVTSEGATAPKTRKPGSGPANI